MSAFGGQQYIAQFGGAQTNNAFASFNNSNTAAAATNNNTNKTQYGGNNSSRKPQHPAAGGANAFSAFAGASAGYQAFQPRQGQQQQQQPQQQQRQPQQQQQQSQQQHNKGKVKAEQQQPRVCRFWKRGKCRDGANCKYAHPPKDNASSSASSASAATPKQAWTIRCTNLGNDKRVGTFRKHFAKFGKISNVRMEKDALLVTFSSRSSAVRAMKQGRRIGNVNLKIKMQRNQPDKQQDQKPRITIVKQDRQQHQQHQQQDDDEDDYDDDEEGNDAVSEVDDDDDDDEDNDNDDDYDDDDYDDDDDDDSYAPVDASKYMFKMGGGGASSSSAFAAATAPRPFLGGPPPAPSKPRNRMSKEQQRRERFKSDYQGSAPNPKRRNTQSAHSSVDIVPERQHIDDAKALVGLCNDMCPEKERYDRQEMRDLNVFEIIPGTGSGRVGDKPQVDHARAVKKYKRAAAGKSLDPHDLRPLPVLQRTMAYLLDQIVDRQDQSFGVVYSFVADRFRSIRADLRSQMIVGRASAEIYEQMCRFHILASHRLAEEPADRFDYKHDEKALSDCFLTLAEIYSDARQVGTPMPNQAEIYSYNIIWGAAKTMDARFFNMIRDLGATLLRSAPVQFALKVVSAVRDGNYTRFFRLLGNASYLQACIMFKAFPVIRTRAVDTIVKAYRPNKELPLSFFIRQLQLEDTDHAVDICEMHGLQFNAEGTCVMLNTPISIMRAGDQPKQPRRRSMSVIEPKSGSLSVAQLCRQGVPMGTPISSPARPLQMKIKITPPPPQSQQQPPPLQPTTHTIQLMQREAEEKKARAEAEARAQKLREAQQQLAALGRELDSIEQDAQPVSRSAGSASTITSVAALRTELVSLRARFRSAGRDIVAFSEEPEAKHVAPGLAALRAREQALEQFLVKTEDALSAVKKRLELEAEAVRQKQARRERLLAAGNAIMERTRERTLRRSFAAWLRVARDRVAERRRIARIEADLARRVEQFKLQRRAKAIAHWRAWVEQRKKHAKWARVADRFARCKWFLRWHAAYNHATDMSAWQAHVRETLSRSYFGASSVPVGAETFSDRVKLLHGRSPSMPLLGAPPRTHRRQTSVAWRQRLRRNELLRPVDVPRAVAQPLAVNNPAFREQLYFSLAVALSTKRATLSSNAALSLPAHAAWLLHKLAPGGVPDLADYNQEQTLATFSKAVSLTEEDGSSDSDDANTARVNVHVHAVFSDGTAPASARPKRTTGCHGAIVLVEPTMSRDMVHQPDRAASALQADRARLHALIESFADNSRTPLLVLYCTRERDDTHLARMSRCVLSHLALNQLPEGRVGAVRIQRLNLESQQGDVWLVNALKWMAETAPAYPAVFSIDLCRVLDMYISRSVEALEQYLEEHHMPGSQTLWIEYMNEALAALEERLCTHGVDKSVSWPPRAPSGCFRFRFAGSSAGQTVLTSLPPPVWNSPALVSALRALLQSLRLPDAHFDVLADMPRYVRTLAPISVGPLLRAIRDDEDEDSAAATLADDAPVLIGDLQVLQGQLRDSSPAFLCGRLFRAILMHRTAVLQGELARGDGDEMPAELYSLLGELDLEATPTPAIEPAVAAAQAHGVEAMHASPRRKRKATRQLVAANAGTARARFEEGGETEEEDQVEDEDGDVDMEDEQDRLAREAREQTRLALQEADALLMEIDEEQVTMSQLDVQMRGWEQHPLASALAALHEHPTLYTE